MSTRPKAIARVTIALDDRNNQAGLPSGRNHSEAQDEVEESRRWRHHWNETLKLEYGKQSAPGADS